MNVKNEKDDSGNITIYVSSVIRDSENLKFGSIESDDEWLHSIVSFAESSVEDNKAQ